MKILFRSCIVLGFASVISGTVYELVTYWRYPGYSACYTVRQITGSTPDSCAHGPDWVFYICLGMAIGFIVLGALIGAIDGTRRSRAR